MIISFFIFKHVKIQQHSITSMLKTLTSEISTIGNVQFWSISLKFCTLDGVRKCELWFFNFVNFVNFVNFRNFLGFFCEFREFCVFCEFREFCDFSILWFFVDFVIFCELCNFSILWFFVNFVIFTIFFKSWWFLWILWFLNSRRHLVLFFGNIEPKIDRSL